MAKWWVVAALCLVGSLAAGQPGRANASAGPEAEFSSVLGRPTDRSIVVSVLAAHPMECFIEYQAREGGSPSRTPAQGIGAGTPQEFELTGLDPGAAYSYRVHTKRPGEAAFSAAEPGEFRTRRPEGEGFVFAVQGDSHPERPGRMFDGELYERTLRNVAADRPDFYFLMGDDFSIERLIERGPPQGDSTREGVNAVYAHQRGYLGIVGKSTSLMLVNGNHEQAAKYLLDGTPNNFAVLAGKARTEYFPLPAPDGFYTGNTKTVEHIGLLRDYYAWEWGDALFVVIDPYWHSDVAVDNEAGERGPARDGAGAPAERRRDRQGGQRGGAVEAAAQPEEGAPGKAGGARQGGGRGQRDLWQITLGDDQYRWLRTTLTQSKARFKFVFCHHVLGTGRGGVEQATKYEWGGEDRRGVDRFFEMRPAWEQPIHDLMRDAGVTIFFQGHDHLYVRQELDGVIYQSCPNPADPTFTAFNREAYRSGDIFPNSGHLRVTVNGGESAAARVEYVRSARPGDEATRGMNGTIVHAYTVAPRKPAEPAPAVPHQETSP